MLKFFRKIRQKLLSENNFSKYLIYAIGEVILVVIGILIAVNVNNLNERNKKRDLESKLLIEIKHSLESDLNDIIGNIKGLKKYHHSQSYIINWLESDLAFNDSLSIHVNQSYYRWYFAPNRISYEILKQNNNYLSENNILKKQIAELYELTYVEQVYFLDLYEKEAYSYYNLCVEHFTELGFFNKSSRPVDIRILKDDRGYLSRLKTLRNLNEYLRKILEMTKQEIENTLEIINKTKAQR